MIEGRNMETESSTGRLRVAIVGPEKNGKSRLASTAPGKSLFIDTDQRREAVAGIKNVFAITLKDPGGFKMPEAAEEVLDIMTGLEASRDLHSLKTKKGLSMIDPQPPEGTVIDNLIFDSISSLAKCVMEYETYNNADLCKKVKLGPNLEIRTPKGWPAWNAEVGGVASVIMRAFALPINVFCIFHETAEKAADSTPEEPKFTGKVIIYPPRYKELLKYFNEVWRVKLTSVGGRYYPRVYALPDYAFDAATTMNLEPVEEPDISKMILKSKSRNGSK